MSFYTVEMQPSQITLYSRDLIASAYTKNEIILSAHNVSTLVTATQYVIWLRDSNFWIDNSKSYLLIRNTWRKRLLKREDNGRNELDWSLVHFCFKAFSCIKMQLITRIVFKLYLHVVNNCALNALSTETMVVKNAC